MSRLIALFSCFLVAVCIAGGCENKKSAATASATSDSSSETASSGSKVAGTSTSQSSTGPTTSTADTPESKGPKEIGPVGAKITPKPDKTATADNSSDKTATPESKPDKTATPEKNPEKSATASNTGTATSTADPLDWPEWRGPEQNRISRETGLIDKWDPSTGENVLWKNEDANSISSPIVMRGKVYSIGRYKPGDPHEQEQVVCVDAESGKTLWANRHNMFLAGVPAERIGWASVVGDPATGRIYSYGTNCLLQCIDGDSGKTIWERSLLEDFGFLSVYGGRTNFPVVFEDLLIISSVETGWGDRATPAHRFVAFDKKTGEVRWANKGSKEKPEDTTYSSPTIAVIDGQQQFIIGSSDGAVWSFQPRTGEPLWHYQMSRRGLNVAPLVVGNTIYMAQTEENLDNATRGMLLAFKAGGKGDITEKATIWKRRGVMEGKSSPILVDGRIYAADDGGNLYIVDAEKGDLIKKVKLLGTIVRGTPLYADGKIYLCSTSGWHCMKPTKEGVEFIQKLRLDAADEVSGSPVASHGKIFLPTGARLYCLGKKDQKPAATPVPTETAAEKPVSADDKPTQAQVVPGVVLLTSGQKQKFRVRLFNDRGQFLKESDADFSLSTPVGQVDKTGLYEAPAGDAHTATVVTAKVGDVTGTARIRVVPPLPWKFDFQSIPLTENPMTKVKEGQPSITWIGLRYRHVIRELDGRKVMVKVNTIPKGTHSQGWMGQDNLHDYTIQADVRATSNDESTPESGMSDIGLIAQRYTLMLMGADQKLRIIYWPAQAETAFKKVIDFPWKPNVWYSMKFRAEAHGEKAVLKGKVWPREEKEPDAWTIEVTDDVPNLMGSPGLFGDTTNKGEFYLDNIQVTPNSDTTKTAASQ